MTFYALSNKQSTQFHSINHILPPIPHQILHFPLISNFKNLLSICLLTPIFLNLLKFFLKSSRKRSLPIFLNLLNYSFLQTRNHLNFQKFLAEFFCFIFSFFTIFLFFFLINLKSDYNTRLIIFFKEIFLHSAECRSHTYINYEATYHHPR